MPVHTSGVRGQTAPGDAFGLSDECCRMAGNDYSLCSLLGGFWDMPYRA